MFMEKSGYLYKRGGTKGQKWQKRWIDLIYNTFTNNFDLIYKKDPKSKPKGTIVIDSKCEIVSDKNEWGIKREFSFVVHTTSGKKGLYWFSADSKEEMMSWVNIISSPKN